MSDNIKQTMKTRGWLEIRQIFDDIINSNIGDINTEQPTENIGAQYIGRIGSKGVIKDVFKKLDAIAYEKEAKPINYK